jgi:hypothetical protein
MLYCLPLLGFKVLGQGNVSKTETTDLRCVIMRKEFRAGRYTIIPQAVKGSGQFYLRIFSHQNFQAQQLGN